MKLPERKSTRMKNYNYSAPGKYFLTICVKDKRRLLSHIIQKDSFEENENILDEYGIIAEKHIANMKDFYCNIKIEKYVIMPNHIHLLVNITGDEIYVGQSGTPVPTNSLIAKFVSTFKRFSNKDFGKNIWQSRSHDHVIRGESDYIKIWEYIDHNVNNWYKDCFYQKEE